MKDIQTIGIIGEGKMGTSIFSFLTGFPFSLRWIGSEEADSEKLRQTFEKKIKRSLKAGIITAEQQEALLSRVLISRSLTDARDCYLVIEAIPENAGLKQEVFRTLDRIVPPSCILASNSSSIVPSRLFVSGDRDSRIIGMHYFYPVALKETVELILTGKTTAETREQAEAFLRRTGKKCLLLKESNSFILNKLFLDIQNEAYRIVDQGAATTGQIDALVKKGLFPIGIFDFMDSVGIDTMLEAVTNYTSGYPHRDYYQPLISKLTSLSDAGKKGIRSGEGFYRYENGVQVPLQDEPVLSAEAESEITEYLRNTYLGAAKRFTMQSGCTIDEMDQAIKEYFGMEKGPFE